MGAEVLSPKLVRGKAGLGLWCPGCKSMDWLPVRPDVNSSGAGWTWNGDAVNPDIKPGVLVNGSTPAHRCHYFVDATPAGPVIRFLPDCFHGLAGQTVPLPDIPADRIAAVVKWDY